ncbi:MAG: Spy/CpxP family protein refolding chaperone [Bryobacterales bacterium]|nr:Spy/CpxP family protein refolding chaperone [Bryobacterales bacterium]
MKKQTLFAAGMAILLAATLAFAQGPGRMRDRGPNAMGKRGGSFAAACQGCELLSPVMARLLNLTDAQKEAIRAEGKSARDASQPVREQLRNIQSQVAEAMNSGATDATLDGLANQVGALQGNLLAISLKSRAAIHNNILTAEQRAKLSDIRSEQRDRRKDRFNRRQPSAPAPGAAAPQAPNGL